MKTAKGLSWVIAAAGLWEILAPFIIGYSSATGAMVDAIILGILMLGFGIYLIIFSFLLYFLPTMWPWSCSVNDKKCDLPNAIPLLVSGIILNLFVIYHQVQVKQNRKRFSSTNIGI